MTNSINWFEIPTRDMDRAVRFYEATFATALRREVFGDVPHAVFPAPQERGVVTGALVADKRRTPGASGALLYLACKDGVPATLSRAEKAGAKVLLGTTSIGEHGFIAVIQDLDGNEIGLHAYGAAA